MVCWNLLSNGTSGKKNNNKKKKEKEKKNPQNLMILALVLRILLYIFVTHWNLLSK
jgi:hypothetical protein